MGRLERDLITSHPIIDEVLGTNRQAIGPLHPVWHRHSYRMLNICVNACPQEPVDKFAVAIAFHDLPAAIDGNLVYVDRAAALARAWLTKHRLTEWGPEVSAMIVNHHKIRTYTGPHAATVDAFRRADWIDVFLGHWSGGQDENLVARVNRELPLNDGRRALAHILLPYALRHPLKPFPMLRW
jgi:hypothetical protein